MNSLQIMLEFSWPVFRFILGLWLFMVSASFAGLMTAALVWDFIEKRRKFRLESMSPEELDEEVERPKKP